MTTTGNTFSTNGFQETISPRGTQSIGIGFAGVLTNPSDHFWCGRIFVTYYVTYTHPRFSVLEVGSSITPTSLPLTSVANFWPASFILFMLISSSMCAYTERRRNSCCIGSSVI